MSTRVLTKYGVYMARSLPYWSTEYSILPISVAVQYSVKNNSLHTQTFSRNLQLFTNEKLLKQSVRTPHKLDFKVLDNSEYDRPLILLYTWMMAKDSHALKYVKFYSERGFDILKVRLSPFDLIRPSKGSQVVASHVLQFLHENPFFNPLVVHGFSVGGYLFGESMVQVDRDMDNHGELLKRFTCQIWDSAVDIEGIPFGLSRAVTDNAVLQNSLEKYLRWYLKFNYKAATVHYENSSHMFHENKLGVPGLFIFSKSDMVSPPEMNARVYRNWEAKGYPVFVKCFESSTHVSHFHRYQKDYEDEVTTFLEMSGVLEPSKGRAVVG